MAGSLPKIGAFVLETLTTGMYTNPLDTIREFIQNATDSIQKAEDIGLLNNGEGRIEVRIDPNKRILSVRDNGVGISKDEVYNKLLNIGMSDKKIEKNAGFRGIGRLASVAYCNTVHFQTKSGGEDELSHVKLDCIGLKKSVSPAMRQVEELANVIEKYSKTYNEKNTKDQHFFEVTMEEISPTASVFLNLNFLQNYLCQIAPVEMDAQYFFFKQKINSWQKQYGLSTPTVTVVIKTPDSEQQIFKPYKTHYKTEDGDFKFDIKDIGYYPEKPSKDTPFWIWYGITDLLGMVDDERVSGFRFRKNNIAIGGPERVGELFSSLSKSYDRINAWYIGEIHITTTDVIPNARRDGFEDNEAWISIKEKIMPFIRERRVAAYDTSQKRNLPIPKVVKAAEKVIGDANERFNTGFVSDQERHNILEQVKKEEEKARKVLQAQKSKGTQEAEALVPIIQNLEKIRKTIEEEKSFAVKNIRSNLDRKQRKLLSEILGILYEALDEQNFKKAKSAILKKFTIE